MPSAAVRGVALLLTIGLLLLSADAVSAAASSSPSCALLSSPPSYTFIGGGFHMQLAIEYPVAATETAFSFDLPKSFFIDEAEAGQLYRMEVVSSVPDRQGTAAVVVRDVTAAYTPLRMASQHFFDIEAPVFKVNYSTNHVDLSFAQLPGTDKLDAFLATTGDDGAAGAAVPTAVKGRLVIPIHSRYDLLDTTTPFSFKDFVLGEGAYVRRCLPKMEVRGTADARCGGAKFASTATEAAVQSLPQYEACLDLPVGLLDDLPHVYKALMGLLVAGAVIVILAIR